MTFFAIRGVHEHTHTQHEHDILDEYIGRIMALHTVVTAAAVAAGARYTTHARATHQLS